MAPTHPLLPNLLLFPRLLRQAGIPVSLEQVVGYVQGLALIDLQQREQVYYATRALLVTRQEHLALFTVLFNRFWRGEDTQSAGRGQKMPLAPRHEVKRPEQFSIVTYMAYKARLFDQEVDVGDKSGTFSNTELLQRKDFSLLTPEELATVKTLLTQMRWSISQRTTRRWQADQHGRSLHLRQILRRAGQQGGVPLKLVRRSRKIKPRPLVLLADISGSMEKYARLTLQFFYSVTQTLPIVETFVFGTRLTRITPQLKVKNIDRALQKAAQEVVDWAGGTRIGESLASFNRRWSRRMLRRGAVVLIISDGWEQGDPTQLQAALRYLQGRSHRLIWLNPLSGRAGYQPTVEGMAAALPYVDDFLPIHSLQSLQQLATHLAQLN